MSLNAKSGARSCSIGEASTLVITSVRFFGQHFSERFIVDSMRIGFEMTKSKKVRFFSLDCHDWISIDLGCEGLILFA